MDSTPKSDDGRASLRPLVPVIGTGFNRWLLGAHKSPLLTDWWAMLRLTARKVVKDPAELQELLPKLRTPGSPTFAWEALLAAVHRQSRKTAKVSRIENQLLGQLAKALSAAVTEHVQVADVVGRAQQFHQALTRADTQRADVLSLNFDTLLADALAPSGKQWSDPWPTPQVEVNSKTADLTIPARYCHLETGLRIWHPHGHTAQPTTMLAGLHRYTRSATYVADAFAQFKRFEAKPMPSGRDVAFYNQHRLAEPDNQLSWVSVAINAPLLLIGVGLSREETDLWAFLHLRARNHANVAPEHRPKIWRFTCDKDAQESRDHWNSVSSGLAVHELNLGESWDEAWVALLDLLEKPTAGLPGW